MRHELPLNNGWKTLPRPPVEFLQPDFDDSGWQTVRLPHTNLELPLDNFDPASFCFVTGYRRVLTFDPAWSGQRVFVVFEAVMARAEVWLDGIFVAEHCGGYTPFEVEISAEVLAQGQALLAVVADAEEAPDIPPFGHAVDYLTYGGIYREVHLEVRPARYLATLTLETPALNRGHPRVQGFLYLDAPWTGELPLVGTVRICDHQTGEERASGAVGWAPGDRQSPYELEVPGALLWALDSPVLYDLVVDTDEDRLVKTFGFRHAEFRPEGFFLNGQPVKLRGLNRHQSWPVVGYAMPRRAQAADADLVKFTLGCNVVRSSHYPPSRHFLDRCDEIGLLVFEEIPGWQHIGGTLWKQVALQNVEEMIVRDRHRPSVILWGVRINESADDDEFYRATNALARRLDHRPTGGVRNFAGSRFFEDVYTYNDFVHNGSNQPLEPRSKIARAKVPYLVTEHNGHMFPTKKADTEARRVEHALRHARVQNAAAADSGISGALGWCLADYGTHADFGSGDQICHHGVVDQFRCFKPAAAFCASQRDASAFGEVVSRLAIGDHDAAVLKALWVFTNSDEVRVFTGNLFVQTFYPDRKRFCGLPHPPVLVDDLIGNAIENEPGLNRGQARTVKAFLQAYQRRGGMPSLRYLVPMFWVMFQKKWKTTDVYDLYTRHIAGWGAGARSYRFEGWSRGTKDWEQTLGPTHAARLELTCDTTELVEGITWDVARVEVRLLDTHGNEVWYGAAPVTLEVEGPLNLQGSPCRPLTGGSTAYWLTTTGEKGTARIRARTDQFVSETAQVTVR